MAQTNNLYVVTFSITMTGHYLGVISAPSEEEANDLAQDLADPSLCKELNQTDCELEIEQLELPHIDTQEETYTLYECSEPGVDSRIHIANSWIEAIGCYLAAFEYVTGKSRKVIVCIHKDETYDCDDNLIDYGRFLDVLGNEIEYL